MSDEWSRTTQHSALSTQHSPQHSLLVYRPGALGDLVLALPALAALRTAYPGAPLTLIGPAAALPLALGAGLAEVVVTADEPRLASLFGWSAASAAPGWPALPFVAPTLAVVWAGAAAAGLVASLRARGARVLHTAGRPPPGERQHVADYLCRSLTPLGVPRVGHAVPRVVPTAAACARAATFLAEHGEPATHWVALQVGSGSPRKNWPLTHWQAVTAALAADGLRPLLLAGPAEAELQVEALARLRPWRSVLVQDWPLDHLAALLACCAGYLGADSGITHLAAAVGTPTVAVFGPTDSAVWAPRGSRVAVVRRPVSCERDGTAIVGTCADCTCLTALPAAAVLAAARARFAGDTGGRRTTAERIDG